MGHVAAGAGARRGAQGGAAGEPELVVGNCRKGCRRGACREHGLGVPAACAAPRGDDPLPFGTHKPLGLPQVHRERRRVQAGVWAQGLHRGVRPHRCPPPAQGAPSCIQGVQRCPSAGHAPTAARGPELGCLGAAEALSGSPLKAQLARYHPQICLRPARPSRAACPSTCVPRRRRFPPASTPPHCRCLPRSPTGESHQLRQGGAGRDSGAHHGQGTHPRRPRDLESAAPRHRAR